MQGGFTLMEVLIASAVGVVLLAATLSLFDNTYAAKARLMRSNEVFQTGIFALSTMQSDIKLAGFYGEGSYPSTVPGSAPDPCSTTPSDWLAALRIPVQTRLANDKPSCLASETLVPDSSIVIVRRAATCLIGSANCSNGAEGTPMIQLSQCFQDTTSAQTAIKQESFTLRGRTCGTSKAPMRQFMTRIYYLTQNNVGSDGIGTLRRLDMVGTNDFTAVTVAQGVQQMRVLYGIDDVAGVMDGVADVWTATPSYAQMRNIVDVKVNLLMRATDTDPRYVNSRSYKVGDLDVAAANDHFHRTLLSASVRVPNVAGGRETGSPLASAPAASPAAGG